MLASGVGFCNSRKVQILQAARRSGLFSADYVWILALMLITPNILLAKVDVFDRSHISSVEGTKGVFEDRMVENRAVKCVVDATETLFPFAPRMHWL